MQFHLIFKLILFLQKFLILHLSFLRSVWKYLFSCKFVNVSMQFGLEMVPLCLISCSISHNINVTTVYSINVDRRKQHFSARNQSRHPKSFWPPYESNVILNPLWNYMVVWEAFLKHVCPMERFPNTAQFTTGSGLFDSQCFLFLHQFRSFRHKLRIVSITVLRWKTVKENTYILFQNLNRC